MLVRSHVEFFYIDVLAPRDPKLGFNRVKLWVGTFVIAYQYYVKLEILNANFSNKVRVPIMLCSLCFTVFGIARLQFSGKYEPLEKDSELLWQIIMLGFLMSANMVLVFQGHKKIQAKLLNHTIKMAQNDSEL